MTNYPEPENFLLTDRERGLIGWALRKQVLAPGFHNSEMKDEVSKLAERIAPLNEFWKVES